MLDEDDEKDGNEKVEETEEQSGDLDIDLSHPKVLAAINEATKTAVANTKKEKDSEWEAHKKNHDKLLDQHKKMKAKLDQIELKQTAKDQGFDEEKFAVQVEAAANAKYEARKSELDDLMRSANERAEAAEKRAKELEKIEQSMWLDKELMLASFPESSPMVVHPGAWADLTRRVQPLIERVQREDGTFYPVIKVNGAIVPGDGETRQMTLKELISKARQGKGPLTNCSYLFVSTGAGSGTTTPRGGSTGTYDVTWPADKKSAWIKEHGAPPVEDIDNQYAGG